MNITEGKHKKGCQCGFCKNKGRFGKKADKGDAAKLVERLLEMRFYAGNLHPPDYFDDLAGGGYIYMQGRPKMERKEREAALKAKQKKATGLKRPKDDLPVLEPPVDDYQI